jgi:glucose/arabinose dehydrogenase
MRTWFHPTAARKSRSAGRNLSSIIMSLALVCGSIVLGPPVQASHIVPSGFEVDPVVTGLDTPVAISFAKDGRMFVAEKAGVVRVFKDGSLLPTPFVDISADVNNFFEHGMLGMTLHPNFPTVPYVYLLYTYDPPGVADDEPGARVARLERIAASSTNSNVAATGTGARTVLLGRNGDASVITNSTETPRLTCVRDGVRVEDCIPQDSYRHNIGTVAFGPDGALYVGNGDSDRLPGGPQNPATHIGAIMRIDPDTGDGLPDNPFYNGDPKSNRSKTWVHGLRNPFRFGLDPVSGDMFIGDVGQHAWESIHLGTAGTNYGWPCYEGGSHVYGVYQNTDLCQAEYAKGPREPLHTYGHTDKGGSLTAGDWYHGTTYPETYHGAYFFADYSQGWVKYLTRDGAGGYTVHDFASDGDFGGVTSGIVQLIAGPDTNLYWVSINNATIYRLRYTGVEHEPPPPLVLSLGFDEGSGTLAADDSGNGNHADLLNGASWRPGQLGSGLALDGVNDIAAVDSSPTLSDFRGALTVAAWVNRSSLQAKWRAVVSRQLTTTAADQFLLGFFDGQPRFGINTATGGNQNVGAGTAPVGEWVHMAGVYDGATMRLYVNGVERASMAKTGAIAASTRPVLIGGGANGTGPLAATENVAGGIDEARVYAKALTATEIAALADSSTPPEVTITEPAANTTVNVGTTVNFAATATDAQDGTLTDEITWSGILHHNVHTHPDALPPTTGGSGSVVLDDHDDDTYLELCAKVVNSAGRSAKDCVEVHPRTTTVTVDSVPEGLPLSFGGTTRETPFTIEANVAGTRTLSAPLSSGCFDFDHWSDGGDATHDIVVEDVNPTFTATFTSSCTSEVLSLGFDEGSGTVAADDSGNGNDADLLNGTSWGPGQLGSGLALDGVNDIAAVDASPSLGSFTDALTVAAWVNRSSLQAKWRSVVSRQHTTTSADQFLLGFFDGEPRFLVNTADGGNQRVGAGTAPVGEWVHLAGVYDGATMRLYVNGVERASMAKTGAIAASTRPVLIGGGANGTGPLAATENVAGGIDEARIYAQALTPSEIAALADPNPGPEATLSLGFDEGAGRVAADDSGNGNDADLLNGASWRPGQLGSALALDGVNDIAAVDSSPTLGSFTDALTVAAWVNRSSLQAKWRSVVSRQHTTTNADQFLLGFFDGEPRFLVNTADGGNQRVGAGTAPVGEWVHLAGVYDGATMRLYVNGVERASMAKTGAIAASTRPVLIGGGANGTGPLAAKENVAGGIDEARIYAQALTAREIAALAAP